MKVLCIIGINAGHPPMNSNGRPAGKDDEVYEGEVYTVIGDFVFENGLYYFLAEKRKTSSYGALLFIPISDIDELDLIKNKNEYHEQLHGE